MRRESGEFGGCSRFDLVIESGDIDDRRAGNANDARDADGPIDPSGVDD